MEKAKLAAWLFDKQIIEDILKQSNYPTTSLYVKSSDFSLSVNYLQQTMSSIQTSLRYRSPYSCSYDSLAAINSNLPVIDLSNQNQFSAKGHSRGYFSPLLICFLLLLFSSLVHSKNSIKYRSFKSSLNRIFLDI